jgi:hypothetical protein
MLLHAWIWFAAGEVDPALSGTSAPSARVSGGGGSDHSDLEEYAEEVLRRFVRRKPAAAAVGESESESESDGSSSDEEDEHIGAAASDESESEAEAAQSRERLRREAFGDEVVDEAEDDAEAAEAGAGDEKKPSAPPAGGAGTQVVWGRCVYLHLHLHLHF